MEGDLHKVEHGFTFLKGKWDKWRLGILEDCYEILAVFICPSKSKIKYGTGLFLNS